MANKLTELLLLDKNLRVTISSLEFIYNYNNVKKIIVELPSGLTEIYPDHFSLSSSIQMGKLLIFEEIEKKILCRTFIVNEAVFNVIKKRNIPKGTEAEVMIFGYRIFDINNKSPFLDISLVNQQIEKNQSLLNSMFTSITDPDNKMEIKNLQIIMKLKFHKLQKEIAFWKKVKAELQNSQI
jgi:hypothetical protein